MKPLLAVEADMSILTFPKLASIKLDGIRCLIIDGQAVTRSLKPIPNEHIRAALSRPEFNGLDGEILCADATDPDCYRKTNSAVMSVKGEPEFKFYVFDMWGVGIDAPFHSRFRALKNFALYDHITVLAHNEIEDMDRLEEFEQNVVDGGHEGIMLRDPNGVYKHGRSTAKEQILLKVKRFTDSEAEVIGVQEEMENRNEAKTDALGHAERSTCRDGLVGKGSMGALLVRDLTTAVEFSVGSGFTRADREAQWPIGTIIKYKSFAVGVKDKPRFPIYLGRRAAEDMS
jgi:DNA ligase-1